jgi:hypothetical protein
MCKACVERTSVIKPEPVATHDTDDLECHWRGHDLHECWVESSDLCKIEAVRAPLVVDDAVGTRPVNDAVHVLHQRLRQDVRNDDDALRKPSDP